MRQCKHFLQTTVFSVAMLGSLSAAAADVQIDGAESPTTSLSSQDQSPPNSDAPKAAPAESQSYGEQGTTRSGKFEQIVVTGTRLNLNQSAVPQEVQVYTQEAIWQSGQTTVADFLNTLPVVSLTVDPGGLQTANAATGVRLHGLPLNATLVLVDGQRMDTSAAAAFNDIFDLNDVPLAAVERIEVLPQGSSAIYGSDAIAGVVNIILKKDVNGFDGSVKYGTAADTHEVNAGLAWGRRWDHGALSVIGSYLTQSELSGNDRPLSADGNYTSFGSTDHRLDVGNPGNVFSVNGSNLPGVGAPYAAVPAGFTGPPTQAEFATTAGQLNKFTQYSDYALIPETHRAGLLITGNYDLSPAIQLTGHLLYSHDQEYQDISPAGFSNATPGFQTYKVSAANPYNPFDETIGIGYVFPGLTVNTYKTDFLLSSIGAQGHFSDRWSWELAALDSFDSSEVTISGQPRSAAFQAALNSANPLTALNPFIAGSPGSQQLVDSVLYTDDQKYRGNSLTGSALLRGTLLRLPSGNITVATGAEFTTETLHAEDDSGNGNPIALSSPTVRRNNYAAYAETRVPLLGPRGDQRDNVFAVSAADRYDHYDGFGGKDSPQLAGELRPLTGLLLRASWAKAFKAPSLYQLFRQQTNSQGIIIDPETGQSSGVTIVAGGNPALQPETSQAHAFGLVYTPRDAPGVEISITDWSVQEHDSVQALSSQLVVNNASDFPGAVVRASSCASGPPCPIVSVNRTFANFGDIDVAGLDYLIKYTWFAGGVKWTPSISATQTYHYTVAFRPGEPATERVSQANDDSNWAPRWKGTTALGLGKEAWSAAVAGRYTGKYRDYDPLVNGTYLSLGNLWYCDANVRYRLPGLSPGAMWARNATVEIGGANILNRQPQFSNKFSGTYGFDTSQADMRGRFLYIQLSKHL